MKIAITGAQGFVGQHFVRAAAERGHELRLVERHLLDRNAPAEELVHTLSTVLQGSDALVHLAASGVSAQRRDWYPMIQANGILPVVLLDAAIDAQVPALVFAGSSTEYAGEGILPDEPAPFASMSRCNEDAPLTMIDSYGATKASGSLLLAARARARKRGLWYLRFASLFGPGDAHGKFVPAALEHARTHTPFPMSPGMQIREWLWVDDGLKAIFAALQTPTSEPRFLNVGTGEGIPLLNIAEHIFRAAGADLSLIRAGAVPYRSGGEVDRLVMDVGNVGKLLHWRASTSLEVGILRLLQEVPG